MIRWIHRLVVTASLLAPATALAQSKEQNGSIKEAAGVFSGGTVTAPILFSPDNTHDLGSASLRVRSGYFGTNLILGSAGPKISGAVDSIVLFTDNAGTTFNRIQFGCATSACPSLKRNGAALDGRLADDSNWAELRAGTIRVNPSGGAATASKVWMDDGASFYGLKLASDAPIYVSSTTTTGGASDLGLARNAAGVWRVSDGGAGWGDIQAAKLLSPRAAGGIGYATGAGGVVTQLTNKATGVTLSTATGEITLNAAALAADTTVSFVLTNTSIAATDMLVINHASAGTVGGYNFDAQCANGSATINVRNVTAGSLSEAIVIRFAIIKGAAS